MVELPAGKSTLNLGTERLEYRSLDVSGRRR